ncbi:SGNH/GDSL hydrolase family protein, partial [Fibrobacterales bacterium]|nr:SGNH/GDSL hydrolase family protein [Fibrobacterales bacterium]
SGSVSNEGEAVWTCILPAFRAQFFTGIDLDDGYDLVSMGADTRPVYVAIGNSITHGVGQKASAGNASYPWLVADALGYQLYNMGVGGSKINIQILDNLNDVSPDLISVLWGYNDVNAPSDMAASMNNYTELITELLTSYPKAKVVAIEQSYTNTTTGLKFIGNSIGRLRSEQLAILKTLQENHSNLFIVTGLNYTTSSSLADAVHLNDAGAASLATGLIAEIPTFVLDSEVVAISKEGFSNSSQSLVIQEIQSGGLFLVANGEVISSIVVTNTEGAVVSQFKNLDVTNFLVGTSGLDTGVYFNTVRLKSGKLSVFKFLK